MRGESGPVAASSGPFLRSGPHAEDHRCPGRPCPRLGCGRRLGLAAGPGGFIHHNTYRPNADQFEPRTTANLLADGVKPGEKVLITEEDIWSRATLGTTRGGCKTEGSFQAWQVKQFDSDDTDGATKFLGEWKTEYNKAILGQDRLPSDDYVASEGFCSAHYFDTQQGSGNLTAIAWYAQGTRLLDTSDVGKTIDGQPGKIKQVGYFVSPDSTVWATYFSPTDKNVIYTLDHQRGIDILRITPGGSVAKHRKVVAPILKAWFKHGKNDVSYRPGPVFGWVCPLVV